MRPTLEEVLRQFGLADAAISAIRSGRVNKHWRVDVGEAQYVLRRYRRERSLAAIEFEHSALRHAAGKNWPVAPAIAAPDGSTLVEADGRNYALFRHLEGRPAPYRNLERTRIKSGLLARFHRDMSSWETAGQREGFGTLWELDAPVRAATPYATFNELLREFELEHRDLARAIRSERYANLRELSRLRYGQGALTLIHADFHHDNLLFQGRTLTGLLDFDSARLDERVADVAISISLDCLAPPAYNELRPQAAEAYIAGYTDKSPLSDSELALIVPLVRAAVLGLVAFRLSQWCERKTERPLRSIERTVGERLPSLRRNASLLDEAIQRGASRADGG